LVNFRDHFSSQASEYATSRPRYPTKLFNYLASICDNHKLAWDCATGNGQAAQGLAPFFKQVLATDGSSEQLEQAPLHPAIMYRRETAEKSSLPNSSVDLLTVAQAVHWFDLASFYTEAKRVMKPGAVIALWTYDRIYFHNEKINLILNYFYNSLVKNYWPFDRSLIETGYQKLPFPFEKLKNPAFVIRHQWTCEHLLRYLYTWSSVRNYIKQEQQDPVQAIKQKLQQAWGKTEQARPAMWNLYLRTGKHNV